MFLFSVVFQIKQRNEMVKMKSCTVREHLTMNFQFPFPFLPLFLPSLRVSKGFGRTKEKYRKEQGNMNLLKRTRVQLNGDIDGRRR